MSTSRFGQLFRRKINKRSTEQPLKNKGRTFKSKGNTLREKVVRRTVEQDLRWTAKLQRMNAAVSIPSLEGMVRVIKRKEQKELK